MPKKRATILDKTCQHIDEKIVALESEIAALRLARQHLQAEQERRAVTPTPAETAAK